MHFIHQAWVLYNDLTACSGLKKSVLKHLLWRETVPFSETPTGTFPTSAKEWKKKSHDRGYFYSAQLNWQNPVGRRRR
jgi:hypothetical protein